MLLLQIFNWYFTLRVVNGFGVYLMIRKSYFMTSDGGGIYASGLCLKLPFFEIAIETEDAQ